MPQNNPYAIPIAIVLAGALIAGALYAMNTPRTAPLVTGTNPTTNAKLTIPPVTAEDHIVGNPNADIVIVEYSDLECPYCKEFHKTMQAIVDEFGKNGKVAWVYRNFPLESLHPNAPKLAQAAECVAKLKGNETYWQFVNSLFKTAPAGTFTDMTKLGDYAAAVGVDKAKFTACYDSGETKAAVDKGFAEAMTAGQAIPDGQIGTPFNIILVKGKSPTPVIGAQPLPAMRQIMQTILADQAGTGGAAAPVVQ